MRPSSCSATSRSASRTRRSTLFKDIQIPVVAACRSGAGLPARTAKRWCAASDARWSGCGGPRRSPKLEEIADRVKEVIEPKRKETEEDPLFVHPSEIKDRLDEMDAVQECLRPAPVVLHVNGVRAKLPFEQYAAEIAALEVYGRKLGEVTTISPSRMPGSILIRIKTRSQVGSEDRARQSLSATAKT